MKNRGLVILVSVAVVMAGINFVFLQGIFEGEMWIIFLLMTLVAIKIVK